MEDIEEARVLSIWKVCYIKIKRRYLLDVSVVE